MQVIRLGYSSVHGAASHLIVHARIYRQFRDDRCFELLSGGPLVPGGVYDALLGYSDWLESLSWSNEPMHVRDARETLCSMLDRPNKKVLYGHKYQKENEVAP